MIGRRPRGDDGASLILALVVTTAIFLSVSSLLTFTDASLKASPPVRQQATVLYDADGAAQAAVRRVLDSPAGTDCFDGTSTLDLSADFSDTAAASITCDPIVGGGGPPAVVPIGAANKPGNAILTLGTVSGEDGIRITPLSTSNPLRVHGRVFSNSTIRLTQGSLTNDAEVFARGDCILENGAVIDSTPPAQCNYAVPDPRGDDPNYAPPTAVPPYRALPPCTTANANSVIAFEPGYYDDAVSLSKMMSNSSPCKNSTWWFKPGVYYFDFHNGQDPVLDNGTDHEWLVGNGTLVAGTPTSGATPPVAPTIPGACVSPITSTAAVGVQFVFGGDSRMRIGAGKVELCGSYSSTSPPVTVFGLKGGTDTRVPSSGVSTLKPSSVTSAGQFTAPAAAYDVGGGGATWDNTAPGTQTGSFTTAGLTPASPVPPGSHIVSATLRVVHGNSAGSNQDDRSVELTPAGSSTPITVAVPGRNSTTMHTDALDLTTGAGRAFVERVHAFGFTGGTAKYVARVKHTGVETVDAIQLDLAYRAPAFRSGSGCITAMPYTGTSGTCALLESTNAPGSSFYVQGTTYAPIAPLDISLNNVTGQVFKFGVIARALVLKQTGSASFSGPVIEVPDDSPGYTTTMPPEYFLLTTYVCPAPPGAPPPATCTVATGQRRVVTNVRVLDPIPASGSRQVDVLSWSVQR